MTTYGLVCLLERVDTSITFECKRRRKQENWPFLAFILGSLSLQSVLYEGHFSSIAVSFKETKWCTVRATNRNQQECKLSSERKKEQLETNHPELLVCSFGSTVIPISVLKDVINLQAPCLQQSTQNLLCFVLFTISTTIEPKYRQLMFYIHHKYKHGSTV